MPVPSYQLDDRSFDDLVNELVARIPGHIPEWTNPQSGDPGHALIDLFAWLGDTLLYRVNLLPERQRLEFLRLLNIPLQPALAAHGLVTLEVSNKKDDKPIKVPVYTKVKGPVDFETGGEITVLSLTGQVFAKRRPTEDEEKSFADIKPALEEVYNLKKSATYITTPLFKETPMDPNGFDFAKNTFDKCVWIALLAADEDPLRIEKVKSSFQSKDQGPNWINIGIQPRITLPEFGEMIHKGPDMKDLWQWEMPSSRSSNPDPFRIPYLPLEIKNDTTEGFSREGIVRLALPDPERLDLPENNVDNSKYAGTGNRPPRIDDEKIANRLVTWIRLRPKEFTESFSLTWLGVNAINIDQRKTLRNVVVATSSGAPDQIIQLPAGSVDSDTFELQIEETKQGYQSWYEHPLHAADRNDRVYELDAEAGVIKLGDGMRGYVPEKGNRIRIQTMRYGGGRQGNLAADNITAVSYPNLKIKQPIATIGGGDAETLEEAEKRIPKVLKHSHRAITADDYKQIALDTPAVELGRVEVLPKFKPQQRLSDITGVISVMVLPKAGEHSPPNPRPDRNILSRIHAHLDAVRPIGVELYVIGTEYIQIGISIAISIRDGFPRNQVLQNVSKAVREFLWPLTPGGARHQGWPLGQNVRNQELEVIVARVEGVLTVNGVNLFRLDENRIWEKIPVQDGNQELTLERWQLPELLAVVVLEDDNAPDELDETSDGPEGPDTGIPIPVVPEVCR